MPRITNAVLVERIDGLAQRVTGYHDDTKADLCEIKDKLEVINGRTVEHESRIGTLEGKQGMAIRLIFYALGSGGLAGGALALLAKFGIGGD